MKTSTAIGLGVLGLLGACILGVGILLGSLFVRDFIVHFNRAQQAVKLDSIDLRRIAQAERAVGRGKGSEALVALAPLEVLDSNRGCMITLLRAAATCMTEGSCAKMVASTSAGRFTSNIFGCDELYEKLLSYSAATARYASPKAAAELIAFAMHIDGWLSPHCDLRLLLASYSLQGGDRRRAANVCQQLWDEGEENHWCWDNVSDRGEFKKKLEALRAQAGEADERWLTAREIRAFPPNTTIYLQPLGDVNPYLLNPVCSNVCAFFGAKTVLLPALPLTHRERFFITGANKYDADHMRPEMTRRLQVPSDAFSVVMVTSEKLGTVNCNWIYAQSTESRHLVSYNVWRGWELRWQIKALSNAVVSCLANQLDLRGVFPCVSTGSGDKGTIRRAKFAFCPDVQEAYRHVDLVAAKKQALEDYAAWGATIVAP